MKKLLLSIIAFLLPFAAYAVQITVPSAPGSGYYLLSTSTGAYVASSTNVFNVGSLFASTTNATSTFAGAVASGAFAITGTSNGCAQFNNGGYLVSTGSNCPSGGGAAFPFTPQPAYNSTSTAIAFLTGGVLVNAASSTFTGGTGLATTTFNAGVQITATGNTSNSISIGGQLNINNTSNNGPALVAYTNHGSGAGSRLLVANNDNTAFDQNVGYFRSQSLTTTAVNIEGAANGQGTLKIDVGSGGNTGNANTALLSIDDTDHTYYGQGAFIKCNGATTTPCFNLVDNTSTTLFKVDGNGLITTNLATGFVQSTSGALSSAALTSGQVTTALGFTPFGGTNPLPIANGGTASTTLATGQLLYGSGTNAVQSVATTSVTCTGNASCSPFTVLGTSPITINASGGTGTGLGTTSPTNAGNLLEYSAVGSGSAFGIATTSIGCGTYATCTGFNALGSASTIAVNGTFSADQFVYTNHANTGFLTAASSSLNLPNSALANSTISGVSLGGTLAALTATDSTLTFSGSYTGATARTVGINLGNANTWTAAQTFNNGATSTNEYVSAGSGIGTSTPGATLAVNGAFNSTTPLFMVGTTTTTGSTTDFIINQNDNVGIGTSSPMSNLAIQSSGATMLTVSNGPGNPVLRLGFGSSGNQAGVFGTTNNAGFFLQTQSINRLAVTSGGLIGIGTTTPAWALDVGASATSQIALTDTSSPANPHVLFANEGGNLYVGTSSNAAFASSTVPSLTIMGGSTGNNVGISSTTPGSQFSIGNVAGKGINLGTGTSTFTGLGGINLVTGAGTSGCFAINGVCVGGSGSGTVTSISLGGGLDGPSPITTSGTITAQLATSSTPSAGALFYATGAANATPQGVGSIGTSTVSNGTGISFSGTTNGVGGSSNSISINPAASITWTGTEAFNTNTVTFGVAPTFSTMTLGSVLFAGTAGLLTQNNANFFWNNSIASLGLGTTTPIGAFTAASSTAPQVVLSDGLGSTLWTMRNINGNLFIATSTYTATSTFSAITLKPSGISQFIVGATSSIAAFPATTVGVFLNEPNGVNASTTMVFGETSTTTSKTQIQMNSDTGVTVCAFVHGTTWTVISGKCN